MSAIAVVSTSEVAPAERLALWGDFVGRHIGHLQSDTFGDRDFSGRLELGETDGAKLCRIVASRHRVVRTPGLIRHDDRGYVKIVAQIQGAGCFEQNGRKLVLTPGEWSLYDMTRTYTVSNPEPINQLALLLPRDWLTEAGVDLERAAVQRFSGRAGVSRQVFDLLSSTFAELPAFSRPGTGQGIAERMADLVRLSMLDLLGTPSEEALRENTRARIKAYVIANLHDPMLSIDSIADAVGRSKRNLHKLFMREETTLNSYIWNLRLDRVRHDLSDPRLRDRSITEIAFNWGFNSSAHFSRLFRNRFGVAPRAYRTMM